MTLAGAGQSFPGSDGISPVHGKPANPATLGRDVPPSEYLKTNAGRQCMMSWEMFNFHYLRLLFPAAARRVGMSIEDKNGNVNILTLCRIFYVSAKNSVPTGGISCAALPPF